MLIKTIRGKLHNLTNRKKELLRREYTAFQEAIQGEDVDLSCRLNTSLCQVIRE